VTLQLHSTVKHFYSKGAASSMHLRCTNPDMHSLEHAIYPSIRLHACNQRSTARGYTLPGSYFTSHLQASANSGLLRWSGHLQLDLQGSPQRFRLLQRRLTVTELWRGIHGMCFPLHLHAHSITDQTRKVLPSQSPASIYHSSAPFYLSKCHMWK
jgi:hypothetical protein